MRERRGKESDASDTSTEKGNKTGSMKEMMMKIYLLAKRHDDTVNYIFPLSICIAWMSQFGK